MMELVNKQIDTYRIEDLLGEGGMGSVYRARDLTLNRVVALKIMSRRLARQPQFQQRFLQEARAAARLDHPSIINIYHFGNSHGLFYMVMAYVPGPTLGTYIQRLQETKQVILLDESLNLVAQIADALGYAHRQDVVHRDVKPDNVLLKKLDVPDREGGPAVRAIVTDFGLAKLLEGGLQTETGTFLGTMPYMSPEQCRGRNIDGRSDIYSLGILLYQLVTGRLPFTIKTPAEAAEKHIREIPPTPSSIRPDLPLALEEIILRAIAKNPDERYQTGEEMARELRQVTGEVLQMSGTDSVPSALSVSLVTELMPVEEPMALPGIESDLLQPADTDYLLIQRQGEANRTYNLEKATITIGRSQDNDLVLDAPGISRHHARLERTTTNWRLIDLGSSNGTWLKESQLLPNIPEGWEPGQAARIGPYLLRWQPAASTAVYSSSMAAASRPGATQILSMDGQLGITVSPTNVEVAPGGRVDMQVEILNMGVTVEHFDLHVEKIPARWVTISREEVQLMPGATVSLPFTIHPPYKSSARAGRHPYRLIFYSQKSHQEIASVSGIITVRPFEKFSIDMQPSSLTNGGTCRVSVQNEGNVPAVYQVNGRDPAEEIQFSGERANLQIPPGQSAEALLKVQGQGRPLFGSLKTFPFQVQVQTAAGETQVKQGQLAVTPRFPGWVMAVIPLLLVLCCAGTALAAGVWVNNNEKIQQTATAVALQAVAAQGTATAQAILDAQATLDANDNDGDGISNAQEAALKTDPNNPDSDGDGLLDGDEQTWGTNPLVIDSDGDTLPDGKEVNETGSSPINPDTDGDGLPDNVDPDPGQLPTPTLTPTITPSPTATPPATLPATSPPTVLPTSTITVTPTPSVTPTSSPTPTPSFTPVPVVPIVNPDCIPYNPVNLSIVNEGDSGWLLTDGLSRMLVLDNQDDAEKALALARGHTNQCFIGRNNSRADRSRYIVEYWTGSSSIETTIPDEDCIDYDETNLSIEDLGATGWRLTDGRSAMLIVDNVNDANDAKLLAQAFSEQCFIGRDNNRPDRRDYIVLYWR